MERLVDADSTPETVVSGKVIGAAIEVHRRLGPGLLESAYEACLCHELTLRGIPFARQCVLPIVYKDIDVKAAFRMDLLVEALVIVEIKAVEKVLPIHRAQMTTYLKLSRKRLGLLLNFHERILRDGIIRVANGL